MEKKSKDKREALDHWRFTSPREDSIRAIAELYGGDPHPWPERPDEWEVFTEASMIDVQLPGDSIFTAYEKWGQGGNQRRCDGERCIVPVQDPEGGHLDEIPCWCEAHNLEPGSHRDACVVTVRLKVVLPNVPGLGIWMLTSSSIYAAMELPAVVDLLDAIRMRSGVLIPCQLELQYREEKRPYEKFKRQYHVPTLHVSGSVASITGQLSQTAQRASIAPMASREPGGEPPALAPAPAPGLPAPAGEPPESQGRPTAAAVCARYTHDDLRDMYREAELGDPGNLSAKLIAEHLIDVGYPMDV